MIIQTRNFALKTFMLFPIFTLLAFVPAATTILSIVGLVCMLYTIVVSGITKREFWCLLIGVSLLVWSAANTSEKIINPNEAVYFVYLIVFTAFVIRCKEELLEYLYADIILIKRICAAWCALVVFSLFLPSSYSAGRVFTSFAVTTFRLSPSAIFIMALSGVLLAIEKKSRYIWYTFIPLLAILLGSSRTYLVVGALMLLLNLSMLIKRKDLYIVIVFLVAISGVIVVMNSSMGDKFISSVTKKQYQDELGVFTSGRSNFWAKDINAFNEQDFVHRMLGCGLNFIRITNGAIPGTTDRGIWAHNDFIQIMISYGYMGLFIYLINMRAIFSKLLTRKLPMLASFSVFMIWFFNAMFNMYYTYICSMIALPITLMACEIYRNSNDKWFEGR